MIIYKDASWLLLSLFSIALRIAIVSQPAAKPIAAYKSSPKATVAYPIEPIAGVPISPKNIPVPRKIAAILLK